MEYTESLLNKKRKLWLGYPLKFFRNVRVEWPLSKTSNQMCLFSLLWVWTFTWACQAVWCILDTKELFELVKFLHILVVKPFILKFELQFYLRASQPRFILLWQMWDTVYMMFLCKTPSDKSFELYWKNLIGWDGLMQKWMESCTRNCVTEIKYARCFLTEECVMVVKTTLLVCWKTLEWGSFVWYL